MVAAKPAKRISGVRQAKAEIAARGAPANGIGQTRLKSGDAEIALLASSAFGGIDGVIGRPSLWIAEDFWVLRFRLMVKRGPW